MVKDARKKCCPAPSANRVEAIVTVDERGQMVLPKGIRERFDLRPGEKLAVITKEREGVVCCLYLFKASELMSSVQDRYGNLLEEK